MASFFDAEFEGPLDDIMFEGHKLCYTVNGRTQTVECLAVVSSGVVVEGDDENSLEPGDLCVSVNGEPLINLVYQRGHVDFMDLVHRILDEQGASGSRVIRFLRPRIPSVTTNAEGIDILSNITLLTLRQEEASLIFDEVKQREYVEKKMNREFERQQANEQRELERKAQEEIKLMKAEGIKQELRVEVSKLRELEKNLHEMQMVVDLERKRVSALEANFYGDYIAKSSLHEVKYPDYQQALGLTIVPMKMTFVLEEKEGQSILLDICVVTNSVHSSEVEIGDFIVQINGIPLVSNQMPLSKSDDDVRVYHERVLDTIAISRRPRTLLLLRPSGPAADSFKTTMSLTMYYVYLSTEQEKAIFNNPLLLGGAAAADARIIHPSPFLYGMQGAGGVGLPFPSSHSLHNISQQQQQQQQLQQQQLLQQRYRSGSQSQHDHNGIPLQHSVNPTATANTITTIISSHNHPAATGGARANHPHGYPPHPMNIPTSSFPPSPQFSSPQMHPLQPNPLDGGGVGIFPPIGYSNGYVDAHVPRGPNPPMTTSQSIYQPTHHQPSPLPSTMPNGIVGVAPGAGVGQHLYPHSNTLSAASLPASFVLPPSSSAASILQHPHPHPTQAGTTSLTTTFNGLTLRSNEEEEISRQVDAEIRRFKAEEEMKRMQEMRRKAEEEEMIRKIEEQALKEINEEKKRLAALLTNPSTL